jgi:hypothetical protein
MIKFDQNEHEIKMDIKYSYNNSLFIFHNKLKNYDFIPPIERTLKYLFYTFISCSCFHI